MNPGEKKKAAALGLVLLSLGLYLGYTTFFPGDERPGSTAARKPAKARRMAPPPGVDVSLLDREPPPVRVGRNIFAPIYRPPEVKPPPKGQAPGAQVTVSTPGPPPPPPPPPKTREELEAEKAKAEMAKFKFVGFIRRQGRMDIFLTLGDEYFVAAKGERVTREYYLKDVGADYLLFEDKATGVEARLKVEFDEGSGGASVVLPPSGGGGGAKGGPSPGPSGPSAGRGGRSMPGGQPGGAYGGRPGVRVPPSATTATPETEGPPEEPAPPPTEGHSL